jgi:hypothetical protein
MVLSRRTTFIPESRMAVHCQLNSMPRRSFPNPSVLFQDYDQVKTTHQHNDNNTEQEARGDVEGRLSFFLDAHSLVSITLWCSQCRTCAGRTEESGGTE